MDKTVSKDDWFHNIDLMSDPALGQFQGIRRQDYITATLASYGLRATNSEVQQTLDFNDDIWDLSPFFTRGEKAPNSTLHFEDIPEEVRNYCKFFLNYFRIKENAKISTIYLRYTNIKNVIKGIWALNPRVQFDDIDTQMIINYIDSKNLANESTRNYYTSIFKFYDYLIRICDIPLLVDLELLALKRDKVVMALKKEDNRLPNIPEDVAKEIRFKAISVMRDADAEYGYRLVACAIIMLFNLGVRIGDLLDFRIDNLKKEATEVNGIRISYIDYYIQKLSRHNTEAYGHTIFASEECVEAFETMKRIRLTQPVANSSDHLFVYQQQNIDKVLFNRELYPLYMYAFHSDICATDKFHEAFTPNSSYSNKIRYNGPLYYPDTRQYRVYLCTDLYAKGVSRNYIEEHLKHLSSTMEGYYNRPEDKTPEYIAYAENVLREMLVNKVEPIGLAGKEIRENIDKFLMQKQVNAVKDFDQVLSTLGDKISIRAKTGGFCFKTSLVPCSQEQGTNKMLCAYNLCPNVYSFYYMLDYTYSQFLGHIEAFEQNYMKGLKNSAEKELVEIKSLIFRALEPQVKQLEAEILKKGMRQIIEQHQNLIDVITNLESIKKQIVEWKQKTVK